MLSLKNITSMGAVLLSLTNVSWAGESCYAYRAKILKDGQRQCVSTAEKLGTICLNEEGRTPVASEIENLYSGKFTFKIRDNAGSIVQVAAYKMVQIKTLDSGVTSYDYRPSYESFKNRAQSVPPYVLTFSASEPNSPQLRIGERLFCTEKN